MGNFMTMKEKRGIKIFDRKRMEKALKADFTHVNKKLTKSELKKLILSKA
jgi:CRISPR/Cas system CSM-associated protein Csm5 (group 7 of RAMP superfamily)